ncbi:hypothetical protein Tco_0120707 [Tanacetum coccineum]
MSTLGIAVVWVLIMLSLSCAASKLAAVVIALSTLSPPPYGQPHLLQGLELEMGVVAQCEIQFKVHEKISCEVEGVGWGSGGVAEPSPSGDIGTKWVYRIRQDEKGMDVKSTFLYGTIDEEVYVSQPPAWYEDSALPILLTMAFYRGQKLKDFVHKRVRRDAILLGRLMVFKCSGVYTSAIWIEVGMDYNYVPRMTLKLMKVVHKEGVIREWDNGSARPRRQDTMGGDPVRLGLEECLKSPVWNQTLSGLEYWPWSRSRLDGLHREAASVSMPLDDTSNGSSLLDQGQLGMRSSPRDIDLGAWSRVDEESYRQMHKEAASLACISDTQWRTGGGDLRSLRRAFINARLDLLERLLVIVAHLRYSEPRGVVWMYGI